MPTPSGLTLTDAANALAAQPFSTLIGAEVVHFEPDETVLSVVLRSEHDQQHGLVHGGVIAYAADNVMAFSAGTVLGPSVVSAGFTLDFISPAHGAELIATARLVTATRRRAVVACTIETVDEAGAGTVCAVAQGTFQIIRHRQGADDAQP